ncbi:MAG: substrate-binding domain-containing protein [Rhodoblastus sp.]
MSMVSVLSGISSMATKNALAELAAAYTAASGERIAIESVGGVTAADRIRAGETFEFAVLARGALVKLETEGHILTGSLIDMARSPMAIAVRAGAGLPDISTEAAFRTAIENAGSIGFSTGPSGAHFQDLVKKWGLAERLADRLVTAPPGVPVAELIAREKIEIGVQQLSELAGAPGIAVVGLLPDAIQSISTFTGGVCARGARNAAAQEFLRFLASPPADEAKRRHGLQ